MPLLAVGEGAEPSFSGTRALFLQDLAPQIKGCLGLLVSLFKTSSFPLSQICKAIWCPCKTLMRGGLRLQGHFLAPRQPPFLPHPCRASPAPCRTQSLGQYSRSGRQPWILLQPGEYRAAGGWEHLVAPQQGQPCPLCSLPSGSAWSHPSGSSVSQDGERSCVAIPTQVLTPC